ncbi:MAG: type II secretion system protein GspJ [Polyangiales bacterium]
MNKRRTRRAGMTLIEIMAAMAILSIIATMLYSAFVQTARNKQRIESEMERYHEIHSGLERIAQELSMAYTSAHRNPNEALRTMITGLIAKDAGSNSRVDFTSFSHRRLYRNAHESDQNELSFFVTQDPKQPGQRVLARREQRRVDEDFQKGGQSQILIENVRSFELSFLDPMTTEWAPTWDTTQSAMQANRLPSQAKILLTVPNVSGRGPDQTFGTRTNFPATYAVNFAAYKL